MRWLEPTTEVGLCLLVCFAPPMHQLWCSLGTILNQCTSLAWQDGKTSHRIMDSICLCHTGTWNWPPEPPPWHRAGQGRGYHTSQEHKLWIYSAVTQRWFDAHVVFECIAACWLQMFMCLSLFIWPLQDKTLVKGDYIHSPTFQAVKMEQLI